MVALAPDITQFIPEINEILALSSKVIGYNTWFDLNFLSASGVAVPEKIEVIDVMKDFAPIYGQWSEKYGDFKFQSLSTCTSYYGYTWPDDGTPHDAIADCKATAYCHRKMTADNETE